MLQLWAAGELRGRWVLRHKERALLASMAEADTPGSAAQRPFGHQRSSSDAGADLTLAVTAHLAAGITVNVDRLDGQGWASRSGRQHRLAAVDRRAMDLFGEVARAESCNRRRERSTGSRPAAAT